MKYYLGILVVILIPLKTFAVPPPKGKSLRSDGDYRSVDVPTGSLLDAVMDLPNRIEMRSQKIQADQKTMPQREVKRQSPRKTQRKITARIDHLHTQQAAVQQDTQISTNLPGYYQAIDRSDMKASDRVVYVADSGSIKLKGLKSGDVVKAVIEQGIKASPSVSTPIRAIAITSQYKGAYFLGEATLDRELKRILLSFTKIRLPESEQVYALKASGLSLLGNVGIEGEYSSQAGKFFVAELASATAAGMVDATIQRQQTAYGSYVQEPSLGNSAKQGLVTALARTADRAAETARQAPEYTETQGFQEIQVIIQDDPTEIN